MTANPDPTSAKFTQRLVRLARKKVAIVTQRIVRLADSGAGMTQRVARIAKSTARIGRQVFDFAKTSPIPRSFAANYLVFVVFTMLILVSLFFLAKVRLESLQLGYRIMALYKEQQQLQSKTALLERERNQLRSYPQLLQLNESLGLYLVPPEEWWRDEATTAGK